MFLRVWTVLVSSQTMNSKNEAEFICVLKSLVIKVIITLEALGVSVRGFMTRYRVEQIVQ